MQQHSAAVDIQTASLIGSDSQKHAVDFTGEKALRYLRQHQIPTHINTALNRLFDQLPVDPIAFLEKEFRDVAAAQKKLHTSATTTAKATGAVVPQSETKKSSKETLSKKAVPSASASTVAAAPTIPDTRPQQSPVGEPPSAAVEGTESHNTNNSSSATPQQQPTAAMSVFPVAVETVQQEQNQHKERPSEKEPSKAKDDGGSTPTTLEVVAPDSHNDDTLASDTDATLSVEPTAAVAQDQTGDLHPPPTDVQESTTTAVTDSSVVQPQL